MTFKKISEKNYPEVKMNVLVYKHQETGALHYHTEYDTIQNSFNIVFKTLPQNNNGLPHILEHSVLNGSDKFPMHGVFFAMQGRNFETFSNAMTGFDSTQYPFSAIDKKGYFNLLSVYMDAVFFPKLEKEIFLQEGWRYTFEDPKDIHSNLQYSGVVYNEMKGSYTNADRVAYVDLLKNVFENTQYENFSGGNPLEITTLKYEDFLAFHKKFYHPTNATIYTFGSIPVSEIHERLEVFGLNKFSKVEIDNRVNVDLLNINGQYYNSVHPGEKGHMLFKGYQIPDFKSVEEMYEAELLITLMQSGNSDYGNVFLKSDSGATAQSLSFLPVSKPVIFFHFKMDELNDKEVNELLKNYFENLLVNGVENQEFENVFDSLEIQVREGEAGTSNIGMSTISQYITAQRYGIPNPEDINDLSIFKSLKTKMTNKDYFNNLIKKYFIYNKNTFDFLSSASPSFTEDMENQAQQVLREKEFSLTDAEKTKIVEENTLLEIARLKEKNLSVLPKLTLDDITIQYPENKHYKEMAIGNSKLYSFVEDTRGVSYFKLYYPIVQQADEDIFYKHLVLEMMANMNLEGMTIEETSLWKQSKIEGLNLGFSIMPQDNHDFNSYYVFSMKALTENTAHLVEKAFKFTQDLSFEDIDLVNAAISTISREHLSNLQNNARAFAVTEAQSGFSSALSFKKLMETQYQTKFLKEIVDKIENDDVSFIPKLKDAYQSMFSVAPIIFFAGNQEAEKEILASLEKQKINLEFAIQPKYVYHMDEKNNNVVLDFNSSVNHVVYVLEVAEGEHDDAGKLQVLEQYIKPYLITNLREKGGAYSAGANYSMNGLFTLSTFRDPNSLETIDAFEKLGNFILNAEIDKDELNVCKLNIIKKFNKPKEQINKALDQFNKIMKEQIKDETLFINSVLSTTPEDIKRIVVKYFINSKPALAIATNEDTINKHFANWDKQIFIGKEDKQDKPKSMINVK